jgi:hypothetical protein
MPYKKRMSRNCHQKHPEIVRVSGKCPENCNIPDVVIQKNVQKMSRRVQAKCPESVRNIAIFQTFPGHTDNFWTFFFYRDEFLLLTIYISKYTLYF